MALVVPRRSRKETSSTAVKGVGLTQGARPRIENTLVRFSTTITSSPSSWVSAAGPVAEVPSPAASSSRSEEHTSELQSRGHLVCRLLLEKKKDLPNARD